MPSPIEELESFGGGVFVTHLGIDSRIAESEMWRAFEEPVLIWVHGDSFDDSGLDRMIEIAQTFPKIRCFRFTRTRVTQYGVYKLREIWPEARIEGVAK